MDWHVNQAKHNGFRFYPRINICDFDGWRWDLNSVALLNLFNKSSESTYIVSVKFDGDLISDLSDSSSGRYSESVSTVTQH